MEEERLMDRARSRALGPVLRSEINTPKVRRRRQELDPDARALIGSVTHVDDPAFLLFFRYRIAEHNFISNVQRLMQVKQAAVRADDDGLAALAKFAPLHVFPCRANQNAGENSRTASLIVLLRFQGAHTISWNGEPFESTARWGLVPKSAAFTKLQNLRKIT